MAEVQGVMGVSEHRRGVETKGSVYQVYEQSRHRQPPNVRGIVCEDTKFWRATKERDEVLLLSSVIGVVSMLC